MITNERVRDAEQFGEWLRVAVHEKSLPEGRRTRAAASCFAIAQDHHHAIVLLLANRLYASGLALLRCEFEAYVRGQWLLHCANDNEVEKFLRPEEPPKVDRLISALEMTPGFGERILSRVKSENWAAMCDFTHSGGLHVQRWNTSDGIESNYSAGEVLGALAFAESFCALAVVGIAELGRDEALANRVLAKIRERSET